MGNDVDLRLGEVAVPLPVSTQASVYFIGHISTPWTHRGQCPKQGDPVAGPLCRVFVHEQWQPALTDLSRLSFLQILYWMHDARRDLVLQRPHRADAVVGTFTVRSPVRPNPIAVSTVALVGIEGSELIVRGLDCLDGTPLIDIKPDRCPLLSPKQAQL